MKDQSIVQWKTKYALHCCNYKEQTLDRGCGTHFGQRGIGRLLPKLENKIVGEILDYFKIHGNKVQSLDKFFVGQKEPYEIEISVNNIIYKRVPANSNNTYTSYGTFPYSYELSFEQYLQLDCPKIIEATLKMANVQGENEDEKK